MPESTAFGPSCLRSGAFLKQVAPEIKVLDGGGGRVFCLRGRSAVLLVLGALPKQHLRQQGNDENDYGHDNDNGHFSFILHENLISLCCILLLIDV